MPWIEPGPFPSESSSTQHSLSILPLTVLNTPQDGEINLRSSVIWCGEGWSLVPDVSKRHISPILKSQSSRKNILGQFSPWRSCNGAGWTLNLLGTTVATPHGLVPTAVVAGRVTAGSNFPSAGWGYYSRIRNAYVSGRLHFGCLTVEDGPERSSRNVGT